jgi:hypothetical protein
MTLTARRTDAAGSVIAVTEDAATRYVPVDPANRQYQALVAAGVPVTPYQPPPLTADDVRAEAARRLQRLVGARDGAHLDVIVANGSREAIRLQEKLIAHIVEPHASPPLTPAQLARRAELKAVDAAIEAIRAASNAMEADPPPDYASDRHWP